MTCERQPERPAFIHLRGSRAGGRQPYELDFSPSILYNDIKKGKSHLSYREKRDAFYHSYRLSPDTIEELEDHYRGMMQALAYRILKNHHSAEDAVQEALLSLAQNMDKLDNLHSRRSQNYIYTVTQNRRCPRPQGKTAELQLLRWS